MAQKNHFNTHGKFKEGTGPLNQKNTNTNFYNFYGETPGFNVEYFRRYMSQSFYETISENTITGGG